VLKPWKLQMAEEWEKEERLFAAVLFRKMFFLQRSEV
jgi:hypothetical protein